MKRLLDRYEDLMLPVAGVLVVFIYVAFVAGAIIHLLGLA